MKKGNMSESRAYKIYIHFIKFAGMKQIKNMASLLIDEEAKRFRNWLYPQRKPDKMLALFDLMHQQGQEEVFKEEKQEMEKKIYGGVSNGKRMDMLHHRLCAELSDFLISNSALKDHPLLENLNTESLHIKKNYALYHLLTHTGRGGVIRDDLLDEAIAQSIKYECYTELLLFLNLKSNNEGYQTGRKEMDKYNAQISFYQVCQQAVLRTTEYYNRMIAFTKFNVNPDLKSLQQFLKQGIEELGALHKQTNSALVAYYMGKLKLCFLQNEKNYRSAAAYCKQMFSIIRKSPSVFSQRRIGYCYDNLAQCYVYLKDFRSAKTNCNASSKIYSQKYS